MFCTKCGQKLPDDAIFCSKCGDGTNINVTKIGNNSKLKFLFYSSIIFLLIVISYLLMSGPKASKHTFFGFTFGMKYDDAVKTAKNLKYNCGYFDSFPGHIRRKIIKLSDGPTPKGFTQINNYGVEIEPSMQLLFYKNRLMQIDFQYLTLSFPGHTSNLIIFNPYFPDRNSKSRCKTR